MVRVSTLRVLAARLALFAPLATLPWACSPPVASRSSAATAPSLGSAQSFAVLGGETVTNTGPTVVGGNLGVSPGSAVTGFPPGLLTSGMIHAADAVALQAQTEDTAAYGALASQACNFNLTGQDLGGLTLIPGVYCFSSSAQLTGALALDAQGKPDAVFIFQITSTLTTASNASVQVINGGADCNVFWQVASSATIGTGTSFVGNILALASITLTTGARLSGRALAQTGAVTMDSNTISLGSCAAPPTDGGTGGMPDGGVSCCQGTACGTSCFDLQTDSSHCGTCGHACAANENCQGGTCTSCQKTLCGAACVDLVSDRNHCGNCDNVCALATPCTGGYCGPCPGTMCGSWCVDMQSDRHDCGRCGNACQPNESCIRGSCTAICH